MARTKRSRLVQMAPDFLGFIPNGKSKSYSSIAISYEEYEALKLCDYELLTHAEAAEIMSVSRPTFTRIYEDVRRKIAKAFIEGAAITFEEENAEVVSWFRCDSCSVTFNSIDENHCCPICGSFKTTKYC